MNLLEIKNLSKSYDEKEVLKDINLVIPKGKIIGLLGKNGAGKTTLIKLVNGLLIADAGEVLFNNEKITSKTREKISYLPERTYLDKSMKVSEILTYFEYFYQSFDRMKARKLLKDLEINTDQIVSHMSKGMQEKLQLVLVMSRVADLYILDEPLGGVDPATRDYILDTILSNFEEKSTVIISTHLIADIEKILDEVIIIDDGQILLNKNADELRDKENTSIDEMFRRMFKC